MKAHLFPHKYQKPAIWIFFLCQIFVFVFLVISFSLNMENGQLPFSDDSFWVRVALFVYVFVEYSSLVVTVFSKEIVEDEYISRLRLESVAIVAAATICMCFIFNLVQAAMPLDSYAEFKQWRMKSLSKLTLWLPIIYFCVFKYKLKHQA